MPEELSGPNGPHLTAAATTAPAASEIPPPTGIIPAFFARMFGPSYRTTLSGYAATVGAILLAGAQFATGKTQQILSVAGILMTGGGIQQMGQNAKDKSVSGVEPK